MGLIVMGTLYAVLFVSLHAVGITMLAHPLELLWITGIVLCIEIASWYDGRYR